MSTRPSPRPENPAVSAALAAFVVAAFLTPIVAQEPPPAPPPPIMAPPSMIGPHATPAPAPAAKPKPPAAPVKVVMTPKAWQGATYSFDGRVETGVSDVTFEAPPAYQEGFTFWTNRMKGASRTELIEHLTTTRQQAANGLLPFRRQVSRYDIDMLDHGQEKAAGGPFMKDVLSLAWEGSLDAYGNVTSLKRIAGPENTEALDRLAFPLLDHLFPRLEGARTITTGESFVQETTMPLPSKLSIAGLESTAAHLTRRYTLREVRGQEAVFDVALIYAVDPATPPTAPRTTCVITGGGVGEAVFNLTDGFFESASQPTQMVIDVEAPLRHLPDQPPDADPGTAKSHMVISLSLSGKQKMSRLFDDPPPAESPSDAAPN